VWAVAEHPELWTDRTPERRTQLDRAPRFGLARDVERLPLDAFQAPEVLPRIRPSRPVRVRGPFLTYLWLPWSYGDRETGGRWHRMRCRLGRHQMDGGQTVQLDGEVVFIERRCRWGATGTGG
jgi:hypothetical protein